MNSSGAARAEPYAWMRRIGWHWLRWCESAAMGMFVLGMVIDLPLMWIGVRPPVALVSTAGLWISALLLAVTENYLLYNAVRCPGCGYNPNRTESGRRLRYGIKTIWGRLESIQACPRCGR
jgi:hypothetical protein